MSLRERERWVKYINVLNNDDAHNKEYLETCLEVLKKYDVIEKDTTKSHYQG